MGKCSHIRTHISQLSSKCFEPQNRLYSMGETLNFYFLWLNEQNTQRVKGLDPAFWATMKIVEASWEQSISVYSSMVSPAIQDLISKTLLLITGFSICQFLPFGRRGFQSKLKDSFSIDIQRALPTKSSIQTLNRHKLQSEKFLHVFWVQWDGSRIQCSRTCFLHKLTSEE